MAVEVRLIANCDDAVVFWRVAKRIPECRGFAVERERKFDDGSIQRTTLANRMGFEDDEPRPGEYRPSTEWPFQRFWWADYSANLGDRVRYRVCPIVRTGGSLRELVSERSRWTRWTELTGGTRDGYSSYFNRGLVISQFMSRYLDALRDQHGLATRRQALTLFKQSLEDHEVPIRRFLSGALRAQMLAILAEAKQGKRHVFAALYELDDEELVAALAALKSRAHVVLANGSITARKGESAAEARKRDQNKGARQALRRAKVEVVDRFISPGALAHNKFLVVTDKSRKPLSVWTGSTNWTPTGLCTQINNGLFVKNRAVAAEYMAQWEQLRDAGSDRPPALADANSTPTSVTTGTSKADIWFTRTRARADLAAIDEVLENAREGILFLMFQPGAAATLGTVRRLQRQRPSLYLKGVVSTLPKAAAADENGVEVSVVGASSKAHVSLDVVQPEGIKAPFASWAATVTRPEFISSQGGVVGFAIVHSKLIVVDPFTKPVVITGSHNFSTSASEKNDENFVIVRGNEELARHYAAHVLSVYHHYRWLAHVHDLQSRGKTPAGFLRDTDGWQDGHLKGASRREIDFWVR